LNFSTPICAYFFLFETLWGFYQAGKMEAILQKLIMPDNAAIQEGTAELKEAFKQPNAIPMLCAVLTSSANPQIRQYSALLLRKKLGKQKNLAEYISRRSAIFESWHN
jgi:hypothetical protein